jgi:hypothetical protein
VTLKILLGEEATNKHYREDLMKIAEDNDVPTK